MFECNIINVFLFTWCHFCLFYRNYCVLLLFTVIVVQWRHHRYVWNVIRTFQNLIIGCFWFLIPEKLFCFSWNVYDRDDVRQNGANNKNVNRKWIFIVVVSLNGRHRMDEKYHFCPLSSSVLIQSVSPLDHVKWVRINLYRLQIFVAWKWFGFIKSLF